MPRIRIGLFLGAFSFAALSLITGCDCSGPVGPHGTPCDDNAQCHGGMLCIDGTCRLPTDSGPGADAWAPGVDAHVRVPVGLAITPGSATLTSTDGSRPTQAFTAQITYDDGTMGPATTTSWSLDARVVGDIDAGGGNFTANGVVGGVATVTVEATLSGHAPLTATAMVEVVIVRTVTGPGVPTDVATTFAGATAVADPTREAGVVYPLDNAVMPQNVYPADIQWIRGNVGDLVRVTMTKPSITVTTYLVDAADHHWLADADAWRSLAQTNADAPAVIRVDRIDPGTSELIRGTDVHVTFARAALTGSVYYWAIAQGRIIRIDDGTATRVSFMPNPEQGCVGCHSVSPSGRYMAGRYGGGDNVGTVLDLTADLTGNPPASIFPSSNGLNWWFSTWSPDETRLLVAAQGGPEIRLYDPMAGTRIDVPSLSGVYGTYPTWSHDGTRIALVQNTGGSWGDSPSTGDISIMQVTGPDSFGAPTIVHHGSDLPGGACDNYPTWTPDETLLAFGHGTGARSESAQSDLFIMAPDGTAVRALAAASPGTHDDFQPRFSPFTQGGYFWLSFLSRRIYGNPQIGNSTSRESPSLRQQIWVTAIRTDGAGGADPSSVPYWLPGQDPHSANIAAYWAPRACRADGDACSTGSECCGGECTPDPTTHALVCSPPPPERCHHATETCTTDADCCASEHLACENHVCIHPLM